MLPGSVPLEMVWIPGGTFTMGSPASDTDSLSNEKPQHLVTVGGYWMGKYELTQGQWKAIMGGTNPSWFQSGQNGVPDGTNTDNRPVERVSWNDIPGFIIALNNATGKTFRLPSEAEWEYACRAGTTTRFYWGDDWDYTAIGNYAWYTDNSGNQTHDVGGKTANAFGLYDMSGNVREWCEDDWHGSYTGAPTDGQAWVDAPRGLHRVARCGSWHNGSGCRSAYRDDDGDHPANTFNSLGFRLSR
jgi:formylglycine-generating enzyme required for sulfatase activity